MKRFELSAGLIAAAGLLACDSPRPPKDTADELTIIVQADKRELEAQARMIKAREEALKNEQGQLEQRMKELTANRAAADMEQRLRLDGELATAKAAQDELSNRVQALQQQKVAMEVQRTALEAPQPAAPTVTVAAREQLLAAREARLSTREAGIAAREADLSAREKALSQVQLTLAEHAAALDRTDGGTAAAVFHPPEPQPQREVPTRAAVESRHKRLLAEMDTRGVLVSDLAPEDQPLNADIHAARRKGDYARAGDLLADLMKAMAHLQVNQRFIEAKMVRLQGARSTARLRDGQRSEVEQILRDVTSSYSDGHYEKANKGLNRIAAILDAGGASG